jgi:hypothetical protein
MTCNSGCNNVLRTKCCIFYMLSKLRIYLHPLVSTEKNMKPLEKSYGPRLEDVLDVDVENDITIRERKKHPSPVTFMSFKTHVQVYYSSV